MNAATFRSSSKLQVGAIFSTTVVVFLAVGAVVPVLPSYVKSTLHESDSAVGVVMGAFAFTSVFFRPVGGRLSDRVGRQPVFATGAAIMAIAGAAYLLPLQFAGIIGARLVLGIGEGWLYTAGVTWAVDLVPPERRGAAISWFGLSIWIGLSFGPVIGSFLQAAGGYDLVWAFAALGPAVGSLISYALPVTRPARSSSVDRSAQSWPREAALPGVALFCAVVGFAAMQTFTILMLRSRGIGHPAAVFTVFALAVTSARLTLSWLPERLGSERTAVGAAIVHATGLGTLAIASSLPAAMLAAVVMGCGYSILFPSLALIAVDRTEDSGRGAALGVFTAFFDAGMGIGAPLAGVVVTAAGYGAMFLAASCLALIGAAVVAAKMRQERAQAGFCSAAYRGLSATRGASCAEPVTRPQRSCDEVESAAKF